MLFADARVTDGTEVWAWVKEGDGVWEWAMLGTLRGNFIEVDNRYRKYSTSLIDLTIDVCKKL